MLHVAFVLLNFKNCNLHNVCLNTNYTVANLGNFILFVQQMHKIFVNR